jgi:acetyl-CoA carboxylase biotin carboxyl carrier protein
MDLSQIKKIIQLVEKAQISHLSVEEDGLKVEVKKEFSGMVSTVVPQMQAQPVQAQPVAPVAAVAEEPADPTNGCLEVKAEMVGMFYTSSNPESPAFVRVGETIQKGKVICIIEAMKLFNEIVSEVDGVIEKVCVENGTPVEFGQTLFLVRSA